MTINERNLKDHNSIVKEEQEKQKRLDELINKQIPYKEMTEEEIGWVIEYKALLLADKMYIDSGTKKLNEDFKKAQEEIVKNNNKMFENHTKLCNSFIERAEAQRKYYEQEQKQRK